MKRDLPWVEVEPVVGNFHLVSIHNFLSENTIAVPESVAPRWVVQCGERVQEACGKATETTVAQRSVAFLLDNVFHAESEIGQTVCGKSAKAQESLSNGAAAYLWRCPSYQR
jgi:hypothetical protein